MVVIAVRKKVISNALHSDFKSALCARYTRNDHRSIRKCKQFGTVQARSMLFYQYLKTVMVKKRHLAVYSDPNNSSPTHKSRVPARNVTREIENGNETTCKMFSFCAGNKTMCKYTCL